MIILIDFYAAAIASTYNWQHLHIFPRFSVFLVHNKFVFIWNVPLIVSNYAWTLIKRSPIVESCDCRFVTIFLLFLHSIVLHRFIECHTRYSQLFYVEFVALDCLCLTKKTIIIITTPVIVWKAEREKNSRPIKRLQMEWERNENFCLSLLHLYFSWCF